MREMVFPHTRLVSTKVLTITPIILKNFVSHLSAETHNEIHLARIILANYDLFRITCIVILLLSYIVRAYMYIYYENESSVEMKEESLLARSEWQKFVGLVDQ